MPPRVSGYVLAGGESSRMQRHDLPQDKALLHFGDETLLERALRKVTEVCGDASILCGPHKRGERLEAFGRCVPDRVEGCGPLGGLDAALHDAANEWLLVVPVDLPLLTAWGLTALVAEATDNGTPNVACMHGIDALEPLPVVLHRSAGAVVEGALLAGRHKLMPVLREAAVAICPLGMVVLPAEAITTELDAGVWFTNVNTPEDLESAWELSLAQNHSTRRASE